MSPASDHLRRRCRNFPGLVNNTVIDWFFPWPEEVRGGLVNNTVIDWFFPWPEEV